MEEGSIQALAEASVVLRLPVAEEMPDVVATCAAVAGIECGNLSMFARRFL